MTGLDAHRLEQAAGHLTDQLAGLESSAAPQDWVLLRRLTDRIERRASVDRFAAEVWGSIVSAPDDAPGALPDLLGRLSADDSVARRILDRLVPPERIRCRALSFCDLVLAIEEVVPGRVTVRTLQTPFSAPARHALDLGALERVERVVRSGPARRSDDSSSRCRVRSRGLRRAAPAEARRATPREAGEALFRILFGGALRDAWIAHRGSIGARADLGIRLRLVFDPRSPLVRSVAARPWELLHDPERGLPLAKDVRTPVVRALATVSNHRATAVGMRDLLVLSARPADEDPLDVGSEVRAIRVALRGRGNVRLEAVDADLGRITPTLRAAGPHVLHFAGHGEFDADRQEGCLVFETPDGCAHRVSAKTFAEQVVGPRTELVVLSACSGGRSADAAGGDPYSGVAASLLEAGVPAVVAMQRRISDGAAIRFAAAFYEALALGQPLTVAVTEGRLAISRHDPETDEWSIPALYVGGS